MSTLTESAPVIPSPAILSRAMNGPITLPGVNGDVFDLNALNQEDYAWLEKHPVLGRYSRPGKENEPITYEFTDDKALLHQYYLLRVLMYKKIHGVDDKVEEDAFDRSSQMLIARRGKQVVGGARLTVVEPYSTAMLPLENEHFRLYDVLPERVDLSMRICENSRFAVLDSENTMEVMHILATILFYKALEKKVDRAFLRSNKIVSRNWRRVINSIGGKLIAHTHVDVPGNPSYPEIQMYLSEITLTDAAAQPVTDNADNENKAVRIA